MPACCPECKTVSNKFQLWKCFCGESFNQFENIGKCPSCGYSHEYTECPEKDCNAISLHLDWYPPVIESVKRLKLDLNLISLSEQTTLS